MIWINFNKKKISTYLRGKTWFTFYLKVCYGFNIPSYKTDFPSVFSVDVTHEQKVFAPWKRDLHFVNFIHYITNNLEPGNNHVLIMVTPCCCFPIDYKTYWQLTGPIRRYSNSFLLLCSAHFFDLMTSPSILFHHLSLLARLACCVRKVPQIHSSENCNFVIS